MVKSVAVRPTTTSRASIPDQSRYLRRARVRVNVPGPRLVVRVDDECVDLRLVHGGPQHRQGAVGPAEGQARDPLQDIIQALPRRDRQRWKIRAGIEPVEEWLQPPSTTWNLQESQKTGDE